MTSLLQFGNNQKRFKISSSSKQRYRKKREGEDQARQRHPSAAAKKSPTNPNFSIGKAFYPTLEGEFYIYGQTITKHGERRSEPIGPFKYLRVISSFVYDECGNTIAYRGDGRDGKWLIDDTEGYYEIIILVSGAEVPPINDQL